MVGSGAVLVGGALAAGGRVCQLPSGQIPPPWAWWENEAPAARAACSSSQATGLVAFALFTGAAIPTGSQERARQRTGMFLPSLSASRQGVRGSPRLGACSPPP